VVRGGRRFWSKFARRNERGMQPAPCIVGHFKKAVTPSILGRREYHMKTCVKLVVQSTCSKHLRQLLFKLQKMINLKEISHESTGSTGNSENEGRVKIRVQMGNLTCFGPSKICKRPSQMPQAVPRRASSPRDHRQTARHSERPKPRSPPAPVLAY
jgi:hypothetical protein